MAKYKIEKGINESVHMERFGLKTFYCDQNSSPDKLSTREKRQPHSKFLAPSNEKAVLVSGKPTGNSMVK